MVAVFPLSAFGAQTTGTVLDPQGLPVPHARVDLTCGAHRDSVATDTHGRFVISSAADVDKCSIDISVSEFAPVHAVVPRDGTPLVVRLRIAGVKEVVDVMGRLEATARQSPFSVLLAEEDFRTVASNTADLIRYTRLLSGGTMLPGVVYVDGLPASGLPPIETVARISVNTDAFSAEYADGDVSTIHIVTRSPARQFRVFSGSQLPGVGGRDLLGSTARPDSTSASIGLRGPIARLPLAFSFTANAGRFSTASSIQAVLPPSLAQESLEGTTSGTRSGGAVLDLYYSPGTASRAHVTYREARSAGSNVGVGGLSLADAGFASSFESREVRATMTRAAGRLLYESGVMTTMIDSSTRANAETLGVSVAGSFVTGGAALLASDLRRVHWTVKQVVRSSAPGAWSLGMVVSESDHSSWQTPNPLGLVHFDNVDAYMAALEGRPTGTLFLTRGNGSIDYAPVTVAPFVQTTFARTSRFEASAGLRADYQSGLGTLLSPRASVTAALGRFNVTAGTGLFVTNIPDAVVMSTMMNDGEHLRRYFANTVSLTTLAHAALSEQGAIRARLDPDLVRPRQWMERLAVERPFGRFVPSLEYSWTRDRHRLGSERIADAGGWLDVVEANRAASRHRLDAQVRYRWSRQQLAAHYEWVLARDNGDGAFSFPEQAGNLAAEWARSTGFATHNVSVVGSMTLPGAVSLNLSETWNSGSPYNIATGRDAAGNGLYVDRGGRPRNSGDGPGYNLLSLYAFRRVALPRAVPGRLHLNLGVQADNLLDNQNDISVGSIAGSASFGRPLAAFPGRSAKVFVNVE